MEMKLPTELDTIQVDKIVQYTSKEKNTTYFGVQHQGKVYFLGKSLKVGKKADGLPAVSKGDYVRIGYYDSDKGRTLVAYATGAVWTEFTEQLSKVEA